MRNLKENEMYHILLNEFGTIHRGVITTNKETATEYFNKYKEALLNGYNIAFGGDSKFEVEYDDDVLYAIKKCGNVAYVEINIVEIV